MSTAPIKFAVQCKKSRLYISNFTPRRASLEITPVEAIAHKCDTVTQAREMAAALQPLFPSFDFQPARVEV